MSSPELTWRRLCGLAVELCKGQEAFQRQVVILKRLVQHFGMRETERILLGAMELKWKDLFSLGSKEGLGRRWALEAYWQSQKRAAVRLPQPLKGVLRQMLND